MLVAPNCCCSGLGGAEEAGNRRGTGSNLDKLRTSSFVSTISSSRRRLQESKWYRWVVLAMLMILNTLNQWDRYLISYLSGFIDKSCAQVCDAMTVPFCEPCPVANSTCSDCHSCLQTHHMERYNIMDGTCLTLVEYSILTGFGFTALYVAVSLTSGRLADVYNRRNLVCLGLAIWSGGIALQSCAHGFWVLLICRIILGIGEALFVAPAYSLIAAYFPVSQRGLAVGIYSVGIYLGGGLASLSIIFAEKIGWRGTSVLLGVMGGALLVVCMCVVAEPPRTPHREDREAAEEEAAAAAAWHSERSSLSKAGAEAAEVKAAAVAAPRSAGSRSTGSDGSKGSRSTRSSSISIIETALDGTLDGSRRQSLNVEMPTGHVPLTLAQSVRELVSSKVVVLLYLASAVRFIGGYSIASFMPLFFKRYHPRHANDYSVANALVVSVGGMTSALLGGLIADRGSKKSPKVRALVPGIGAFLGMGAMIGVVASPSFFGAIAFLALEYLFAECWFGPAMSLLQRSTHPDVSGLAASVFVALTTLTGSAAPPVIAAIVGKDGNPEALRNGMTGGVVLSYTICSILFVATACFIKPAKQPGQGSMRAWVAMHWTGLPISTVVIPMRTEDWEAAVAPWSPTLRLPALSLQPMPHTAESLVEPPLPAGSLESCSYDSGEAESIVDSLAIAETLAEMAPEAGLWPEEDRLRARARAAAAEMHSGFPVLREFLPFNIKRMQAPRPPRKPLSEEHGAALRWEVERLQELWRDLRNGSGNETEFLCGDKPCFADIMFAPVATRFVAYNIPMEPDTAHYIQALLSGRVDGVTEWIHDAQQEHWVIDDFEV